MFQISVRGGSAGDGELKRCDIINFFNNTLLHQCKTHGLFMYIIGDINMWKTHGSFTCIISGINTWKTRDINT